MTDQDERPTAEELNLMLADLARGGGKFPKLIQFSEKKLNISNLFQEWNLTFLWEQETSSTSPISHSKRLEQCHKCPEVPCFNVEAFTLPTQDIPDNMYVQINIHRASLSCFLG